MTTVSTCDGSKPAARKFLIQWPEVGAPMSPLPVSMRVRPPPVRRSTRVVKVIAGCFARQEGLLHGLLHLGQLALRTKPSSGRLAKPSLMAVTSMSPTL